MEAVYLANETYFLAVKAGYLAVKAGYLAVKAGYLAVEALQPELGELCVLAVLVVHPPLLSDKSGTQYQSD